MSCTTQKCPASRDACTAQGASEALSRIDQAMGDMLTHFKESVVQEIKTYKAFRGKCEELIAERTSVIQQLAVSDPEAALQLNAGINLTLDIPAILFREEGVLCSFKPVPEYLASPEPKVATKEACNRFPVFVIWLFYFFGSNYLTNWLLQRPSGSCLATDTTSTDPSNLSPKAQPRRAARAASRQPCHHRNDITHQ